MAGTTSISTPVILRNGLGTTRVPTWAVGRVPRENLRDKDLGSIFAPAQPTRKGREGRGAIVCSSQGQAVCSRWSSDTAHPQAVIYRLWEACEALKPQVGARKATLPDEHRPWALLCC